MHQCEDCQLRKCPIGLFDSFFNFALSFFFFLFLFRSAGWGRWNRWAPAVPLTLPGNLFYTNPHGFVVNVTYSTIVYKIYFITLTFVNYFFFLHNMPLTSLPVQIFQAIPEHVGFNIELKWICQMKVHTLIYEEMEIRGSPLGNVPLKKCGLRINLMLLIHRMGHGLKICPPTLTWTPSWTSFCPAFCKKVEIAASSSPASTRISAQCKHRIQ